MSKVTADEILRTWFVQEILAARAEAWEEGRASTVRMVKETLINAGWEPADIGTFGRESNPYTWRTAT